MFEYLEISFSAVSLLGMAMVARHETRLWGFITSAVGNVFWIIYGIFIWHVPYLVLFGGYLIFNSIGIHDEYATWCKIHKIKHHVKYT
jgi:hypothetical protein